MNKTLIAIVASLGILASSVPAKAGNDAGLLFGGLIGGLIIGDVLSNNHRHRYYDDAYAYENTPQYVRICRTHWIGHYDYYGRYVQQPRRVCEWVPR